MNDTETKARRLFAAATEDMPPEIDLLDGFVAARRRDRSRRTRRGAVLSAGIAVAAASVTAVTLTMGSAPPALATLTSALTRTLTQSYHLSEQDSYYYIVNGQIRNPHHDACTTEADPVRHLLATYCSNLDGPTSARWAAIPTSTGRLPRAPTVNTGPGYRPHRFPRRPAAPSMVSPPPHRSRCWPRSRRPPRLPWPDPPRGPGGPAHGTRSAQP